MGMPLIHIVGFGEEIKLDVKARRRWSPGFPSSGLEVQKGDAVILNLLTVVTPEQLKQLTALVDKLLATGETILVVTAPFRGWKGQANYSFLPWPETFIREIGRENLIDIRSSAEAPDWASQHFSRFKGRLVSPVCFSLLPSGAYDLAWASGKTVAFLYQVGTGRILLMPPIRSILLQTREEPGWQSAFLASLVDIVTMFKEVAEERPGWLEEIHIRNEHALQQQCRALKQQLSALYEEKAILNDDGAELTRKVAAIFRHLGFQAKEKEVQGMEDIEISEGQYRAVVECSGSKGYYAIDKARQLIHYVAEEVCKGILVVNPWKDRHPRERKLAETFTAKVLESAARLGLCLMTVPHLFAVSLNTTSDEDKTQVRASIKACKGLWQYPAPDWT